MVIPAATRQLMEHHSRDSFELQELKRLWWKLYNTKRTWPKMMDASLQAAMDDVETLIRNLQITIPVNARSQDVVVELS